MSYELHHGNCLDIMPSLRLVQHVITDPPYEVEAHTKGRRLLGTQRIDQAAHADGARDRVESLWLSPNCPQASLFPEAA